MHPIKPMERQRAIVLDCSAAAELRGGFHSIYLDVYQRKEKKLMARKSLLSLTMLIIAIFNAVILGNVTYQRNASAKERPELDVPYEPTSYGIAAEMLKMADVTSRDLIYDLGCGDGRIVIMAAQKWGTKGVGVDMDPERIRESKENAERAGVTHLVRFYEKNLFDTDISGATVVMLYLWPEVNLRVRPKLLNELRPGTRIVSHSHTMGEWADDATREVEKHTLHFFIVPVNATGRWRWTDPEKGACILELAQKFQKVKGSMRIGEEMYPIFGSLRGNDLSFSVETNLSRSQNAFSFQGRISGDTIDSKIVEGKNGRTMSRWKATRDSATRVSIAE
jgi:SAM-dependent methyltransferase